MTTETTHQALPLAGKGEGPRGGSLFVMPYLVFLGVFSALPVLASIVMVFLRWDMVTPPEFIAGKGYEVEAKLRRVEHRVIAFDDARLFQLAHTAQAGRRGNADAVCEIDIGHAPVALQFPQDFQIDGIKFDAGHGAHSFISMNASFYSSRWDSQ